MFAKKQRRERLYEREQHQANQHSHSEKVQSVNRRLEQIRGSVLRTAKPESSEAETERVSRVKASLARTRERFNQDDGSGDKHRIRGSVLTAAALGAGTWSGVKKARTVAKYGALGVGGVVGSAALLGFGAPALAAGGALYGAHKLHGYIKKAPLRAERNLASYRTFRADEEVKSKQAADDAEMARSTAVEAAAAEEERVAAMTVAEREAYEETERRIQREIERKAAQERLTEMKVEAFKRGNPIAVELSADERLGIKTGGGRL
jgi:hypothetical protein